MTRIIVSTLFVLLLSYSTPSFALGKLGHQLICQLSYDLLPKTKQQEIDSLLDSLPKATKQLINQYNYQPKEQPITFAASCTWPDAIKKNEEFDQFKPWHYINVTREQNHIDATTCQENCITQAISHHKEQLNNGNTEKLRQHALMFLGHWLGDIHQPLHVSFSSDLGGNKLAIKSPVGNCKNLHWYWDQCLLYIENLPKNKKPFDLLYQELSTQLTSITNKDLTQGDQFMWANESLTLVRQPDFQYCTLQGDYCKTISEKEQVISMEYHKKYQPILKRQIIKAAFRLSHLLTTNL